MLRARYRFVRPRGLCIHSLLTTHRDLQLHRVLFRRLKRVLYLLSSCLLRKREALNHPVNQGKARPICSKDDWEIQRERGYCVRLQGLCIPVRQARFEGILWRKLPEALAAFLWFWSLWLHCTVKAHLPKSEYFFLFVHCSC